MRSAETALPLSRLRPWAMALCAAIVLTACGGGGGGGGSTTSSVASTTNTTTTVSGTTNGAILATLTGTNVLPLIADSGPSGVTDRYANRPFVSVTICPPGLSTNCQTIDHVLVDTGSTGLRLIASTLTTPSAYPLQTTAAGTPYAECATFISGYTWGSVRKVDLTLGGMTASSLPIQVIADAAYPTVPVECSGTGSSQNNVADLGAKGILGISQFIQDCGSACANAAIGATYYSCASASTCTPAATPLAKQITQPIAVMPTDNNGSMIQLPSVSASGQTSASGYLVLGIGTRANNAVGSAVAYGVNRNTGYLSSTYNGRTFASTAFDSGSNFYFFTDSTIPTCSNVVGGFYCPTSTLTLSSIISGTGTAPNSATLTFQIANASNLFTTPASIAVLPNVGATLGNSGVFLYGLPFFYGRNVFTGITDAGSPLGTGPFVAF